VKKKKKNFSFYYLLEIEELKLLVMLEKDLDLKMVEMNILKNKNMYLKKQWKTFFFPT